MKTNVFSINMSLVMFPVCSWYLGFLLIPPVIIVDGRGEVDDILQLTPEVGGVCPVGYFQCNMTAQCVPQRLNCDGTANCDDASDEWDCVNDVDAHFWDHLFRKQPYARHDDIPIGNCFWSQQNLSCPCRGQQLLCRFQQLTTIPANLPNDNLDMLDLTGNRFPRISMDFLNDIPTLEILVLKHCNIIQLEEKAFHRFSELSVKILYLNENRIRSLPRYLFPVGNQLKILILSGNWIHELHDYDFVYLDELIELDLRDNRLSYLNEQYFTPLRQLQLLYLNENQLTSVVPGMFPILRHLHTLSLAQNLITRIERFSFPLPHLRHLYLAGNQLSELSGFVFCDLYELQGLHLNDNKLSQFAGDAFACLHNLTSLLLNDNEFHQLDIRILQNLTSLNYIYFSWFHLCRAALHVRVCEPHGDGISSTDHLLDNTILRVSVWVMAIIAIVGNLLVLFGRYWYRTRSNMEHSLYLRHLAASDLLMGIYLAIIAMADILFRGQYIIYDEQWRHSGTCAFSGFLSTFSSQSSTLLLTLITWDRLSSVMNPLQTIDRDRKRIIGHLMLLWGLSFGLAATPLLPIAYFGKHFYGTNGVCLSLYIHEPYAQGWQYSAILFICLNTFSLLFILISYMRMLQAIRDSGGGIRSTVSGREGVVATRFAIIIITDCACWLPVICVKMAALAGCTISSSLYAWMAVLVLPVNSALNPILYTLTTAIFKQQLMRYWYHLRSGNCRSLCVARDSAHLTPLPCESAVSTSLGQFSSGKSNSGRKRSSQRQISYV